MTSTIDWYDAHFVVRWMTDAAIKLDQACSMLTDLDAARGDADHGVNMRDGFAHIVADFQEKEPANAEAAFLQAATVLRKRMGGTSGALWAAALRRAGKATAAQADLSGLVASLEGAAAAVAEIGGAKPGDNTMLDALLPAAKAARSALNSGADSRNVVLAAQRGAQLGAQETAGHSSKKGRSSYLGERGAEHADPGATSAAIVITAIPIP